MYTYIRSVINKQLRITILILIHIKSLKYAVIKSYQEVSDYY